MLLIYIGYFIFEAYKKRKIDRQIRKYEESIYTTETKNIEKKISNGKQWYYEVYLKSDHWQNLRQIVLERAGHKCQVCANEYGLKVHHNTYKNRGHEDLSDLCVLCGQCHEIIHKKRFIK